jgi:hypothetical protein
MKKRTAGEPWLKISTLRVTLLICIAIAGCAGGALSYYFIRSYQYQLYKQEFDSTALDSFESIKESLLVKLQLNTQVALGFGLACPTRSQWPHCSVSTEEFLDRTSSLTVVTKNSQFALLPIVPSNSLRSFEAFALNLYQSDGGYPPISGSHGVYSFDENFNPTPVSNLTKLGSYDIFIPVFQLSNLSMADGLLYDAHSDPVMGITLEQVLQCVSENSQASLSLNSDRKQIQTRCSAMTDFIPMLNLRSSVIGTPIFAYNEPDTVVGFAGSMFTWESVLSVSSRFDSTFQFVIESSTSPVKLMYSVRNGMVKEIRGLDHLKATDGYFDDYLTRSFSLDLEDHFSIQSEYTMTYYSSKDPPSLAAAIAASVSCIFITLLITVIFEVFNFLSKRETREAKTLLDSKRIFVRFISHEIRFHLSLSPRHSHPPLPPGLP